MSDQLGELIARTRAEQGLPPRVTDAAAITRIADLLRLGDDEQQPLAS